MKRNLMTKLMAQVVVVVMAISLILGGGSYFITKASMEEQIFSAVRTEAKLRAKHIEAQVESLKSIAGVIATEGLIQTSLSDETLYVEASNYFNEVQGNNSELIEMLILVNKDGDALFDHKTTSLDINISERPYFQELLSSQATVISDVVISKSTGNPVVVVAVPVVNNGSIEGAVLATVMFENLRSIVKDAQIGTDGYGYMANASGLVLSHKNPEMEFNEEKALPEIAKTNNEFADLWNKMQTDEQGEGFYTYNNTYKFVAFEKAGPWIIALTADEKDYLSPVMRIRNLTLIIALVMIVLSLMVTYVFARVYIVSPIKKLKYAMGLAGSGDFTANVAIKGKDELSELSLAYLKMIDSQKYMIKEMQKNAEQMNQMAEELNASSQEVSATSEEMTAAIEIIAHHTDDQVSFANETVSTLSELEEGISTSAALVEDALSASKACTEEAAIGKQALAVSRDGMHKINAVTLQTVDSLHSLAKQAEGVTSISTAIAQIASQINLLALNASIEAARAGEHGRGFSVVAEEVRKLAEQTTAESGQINNSLGGILKIIEESTRIVDEMKIQVDEGSQAIEGTQEALEKLYYGVESMIALNEAVLFANQGERVLVESTIMRMSHLEQVTKGIATSAQEMTASTQEQAAITESLTQVAEETSGMAEAVLGALTRFKL